MRIGIVGAAGKIGQMRVETVRQQSGAELVAVMDLALDRARAVAPGVPAFDRIEPFLDVAMDAVVISTPGHVRADLCAAAFARGLHVLTEKPLAPTVETTRAIVAGAQAAGRHLGGGFNMRYYPAFKYVRDVLAEGRIGTLDHLRIYGGHSGLSNFAHDWEYKAEFSGGGALWDVGIHMSDMARHLLGEITEVYGVTGNRVWEVPGSEDNAIAVFRSPDGIAARYQASWIDWNGYSSVVEAYGSRGMVRGAYAPMHNTLITLDRPGGTPKRETRRYLDVAVREKLRSWKTTAIQAFQEELADFLALCGGAPSETLRIADGHAAQRAVEIADAVRRSSESHAVVTLPDLGPMRP